jgi:hypothetical protein
VIADVEFRQRSELRTLNLRFAREIYPSGNGFLSEVNQVTAYVQQRFSQSLTGIFGLRYDDIATLDQARTTDERDYARAEIEFRWALGSRMSLLTGYTYTAQSFGEIDVTKAKSNAVYFGVNYRGLSRIQ